MAEEFDCAAEPLKERIVYTRLRHGQTMVTCYAQCQRVGQPGCIMQGLYPAPTITYWDPNDKEEATRMVLDKANHLINEDIKPNCILRQQQAARRAKGLKP